MLANPDWLDLSDQRVVVLGAGAEMGPLRSILSWGGDVVGVDLPRPDIWKRVLGVAAAIGRDAAPAGRRRRALVGRRTSLPTPGPTCCTGCPRSPTGSPSSMGPLVLGNYVYADGATNVRVSTAVDALSTELMARRTDRRAGVPRHADRRLRRAG